MLQVIQGSQTGNVSKAPAKKVHQTINTVQSQCTTRNHKSGPRKTQPKARQCTVAQIPLGKVWVRTRVLN